MIYFDKKLVAPKTLNKIKFEHNINDAELDDMINGFNRMALGIIENKVKSNRELKYSDDFKTDMVMNYSIGKCLQGTQFEEEAKERFEVFYVTLNSIYDSEEDYYSEQIPGVLVFNE